jgi:threonine synthase
MPFTAQFRCIAGCSGAYPLERVIYRCPTCGDLLEVVHDLAALRERSAAQWKQLFAERWRSVEEPYGSGVWGKHEWVAPELATSNIVSFLEGVTQLTRVPHLARELGLGDVRVKQCGTSHSGSFKDLGMTVLVSMVNQMIARGQPIRAIACASTGDTSAALAAYAAAAGIRAVVILPRGKISTAQLVQPLAMGSLVLAIDTDFDGCMRIVQELADREGVYLANSMNSLRVEGQKTVAIEIAQQLGSIGARASASRRPRTRARCTRATPSSGPSSSRSRPSRRSPRRSRSATRSASRRRSARCVRSTASSKPSPRPSSPTPRRAPTAAACSPIRTPASRSPHSRSSRRAATSPRTIARS